MAAITGIVKKISGKDKFAIITLETDTGALEATIFNLDMLAALRAKLELSESKEVVLYGRDSDDGFVVKSGFVGSKANAKGQMTNATGPTSANLDKSGALPVWDGISRSDGEYNDYWKMKAPDWTRAFFTGAHGIKYYKFIHNESSVYLGP